MSDQPVTGAELPLFTRRMYYLAKAAAAGGNIMLALEAVASTAIEHPDWDMTEQRTWAAWETEGA